MRLHQNHRFGIIALTLVGTLCSPSAASAADPVPGQKVTELPGVLAESAAKAPSSTAQSKATSNQQSSGQPALPPLPPPMPAYDIESAREQAFQDVINQTIPMTPEQIKRLRIMLDEQQRAKSELPGTPPKPVLSTLVVRGDPGESPPVVRLSRNFVTTLVFSDITGAPWPVTGFGQGGNAFDIKHPDTKNSPNVLTVSPQSAYAYGNMQVTLEGRTTPVMVTLVSDQKQIDYQANLNIGARGPNAAAPEISSADASIKIDPVMMAVMDGVPPAKAKKLEVSDTRIDAWKIEKKYYLRTRMTLYSPAWTNYHASPDGMRTYEINQVPVIVAGENGNPQQISIGEAPWHKNLTQN